jgi:hypothetical protein
MDNNGLAVKENADEALHPVLSSGRLALTLALLPLVLLVGAVTAIEAAGRGAEYAVMTGIVTGDAADHGALDAALGVGWSGYGGESQCGGG